MTSVRAVVVDLGGVVFLPASNGEPWSQLGEQLGVPPHAVPATLWHSADIEAANIGRLSAEEYAERAAGRLGVTGTAVLAAIEAVYAGRLNAPLVAYLRTVAPTVVVAALTNNWSFLDRLLPRHGIADLFEVVVNSSDVGCCKPGPEIFQILLARLACPPETIVFVDDDAANVAAARALGLRGIHFDTPASALGALEAELRSATA